jgi:Uma2 family endonuclease
MSNPNTYPMPEHRNQSKERLFMSQIELQREEATDIDYHTLFAGKIMVDNTKQFKWIVYLKEGIETHFGARDDVFVAGDLLWMPDEQARDVKLIPDTMVVFGRPPHDRSSYRQWEEDGIAPQVVFEVLSPSNKPDEMKRKKTLYQQYGVEEYYEYDPENNKLVGYIRESDQKFKKIPKMNGWSSQRLGLTFRLRKDGFRLYRPDGEPIRNTKELEQARIAEQEARIAEQEARKQAEAREKAEQKARIAEQEARKQAEAREKAEQKARIAEQEARIAEQEARIAEQEARKQAEAKTTELQKELNALKNKLATKQDQK